MNALIMLILTILSIYHILSKYAILSILSKYAIFAPIVGRLPLYILVLQSGIFPKVEPLENGAAALFHVTWRTRLSILTPPFFRSCQNGVQKWSKNVKIIDFYRFLTYF